MAKLPKLHQRSKFLVHPTNHIQSPKQFEKIFHEGLTQLNTGEWNKASQLFEIVVQINPKHFDAIHLLGVIAAKNRKFDKALALISLAIDLNPNNAAFHCNRGNILNDLKKFEEAIVSFKKAIALNPRYALAYTNMGLALYSMGNYQSAKKSCEKALSFDTNFSQAYFVRGIVHLHTLEYEPAILDLKRAATLNANDAQTYINLALALQAIGNNNDALLSINKAIEIQKQDADIYFQRGNILFELKHFQQSVDSYQKAIELNSVMIDAYSNKGLVLQQIDKMEEALENYNQAIKLSPNFANAYFNRGNLYKDLSQLKSAIADYKHAININPQHFQAFNNLGIVYKNLSLFNQAIECFNQAIAINPQYAEAQWNKSIELLRWGNFSEGWPLFNWRFKTKYLELPSAVSEAKPWLKNKQDFINHKHLIWAEQGIGDQILFTSLLDEIDTTSTTTFVIVDNRLLSLYRRSMPKHTFLSKEEQINNIEIDFHMAIGDLGQFFRPTADSFNNRRNYYLLPDKVKAANLRANLKGKHQLLCGITWSSKQNSISKDKSVSLQELLPILKIKNIAFVSLQYGDVSEQLSQFNLQNKIDIQTCDSVDNFNDLDGHASLIDACDFVVSISNTSAHMAGAIGKETYLLYPKGRGALWYWANQVNGRSMWYPTVQIYQQQEIDQWSEPVQKIKQAIEKKIDGTP